MYVFSLYVIIRRIPLENIIFIILIYLIEAYLSEDCRNNHCWHLAGRLVQHMMAISHMR